MSEFGKCNHIFCLQCLLLYTQYKIQRFEDARCPQDDCEQPADTQRPFFQALAPKEKQQHAKIRNFYNTLQNPSLRLCPNEKCEEGVLEIEEGEPKTKCSHCEEWFCCGCFFPVHEGRCEDNEIRFFRSLQLKQCGKCKMMIERKSGCNHIKCVCGYEFCYVCCKGWSDEHYSCGIYQPNIRRRRRTNNRHLCEIGKTIIKVLFCFPAFVLVMLIFAILSLLLFVSLFPFLVCFGWIYFSVSCICDEVEAVWKKVILFSLFPLLFPLGLYRTFTNELILSVFTQICSR